MGEGIKNTRNNKYSIEMQCYCVVSPSQRREAPFREPRARVTNFVLAEFKVVARDKSSELYKYWNNNSRKKPYVWVKPRWRPATTTNVVNHLSTTFQRYLLFLKKDCIAN